MKNKVSLAIFVALIGIAAVYYYWQSSTRQELPLPPRSEAPPPPAPSPVAIEPPILHPIEQAQSTDNETKPLPALDDSDATMQDALTGFFGQKVVEEFFNLKDIVRSIVVTVDNLPRQRVPMRYRLLKPVVGQFLPTTEGDDFFINPDNYERYKSYVLLAEAVNIKKLVTLYVHFYPLFQEEYRGLGYPKGYFNDRLVQAIDDMLATPDYPARIKLIRPNVLYQFSDPDLEALSAGQKIMIRMGPENALRIKARLQKLRRVLTGQVLKH
ncbi:MAG: DUF3014 domain-containing protein [Sulfuricaulis sp.]